MKKLLIIPMLFACYMGMCQASVIGKSIRLQKFEVAQHDFPKEMNWKDAKAACAKLGKGWRLPTIDELNVMYKYKHKIGGFERYYYWSSTEDKSTDDYGSHNYAWTRDFTYGTQNNYNGYSKYDLYYVRAVRAF